jgi:hypothetical protein
MSADLTLTLTPTLYNLPGDIYDTIAAFLPNPDLFHFLTLSPHISVSDYLLWHRKWEQVSLQQLAAEGDLKGVQYKLQQKKNTITTEEVMVFAAYGGQLAVVQYLHRIGAPCATQAMDFAAYNGHLVVMQYLHSIGASCTTEAMDHAACNGHLAVVEFLHSIGASCTTEAMDYAACNGHLAVVKFLHSIGASCTAEAIYEASSHGHVAVVRFLKSIGMTFERTATNLCILIL